jgi:hypothetical protein
MFQPSTPAVRAGRRRFATEFHASVLKTSSAAIAPSNIQTTCFGSDEKESLVTAKRRTSAVIVNVLNHNLRVIWFFQRNSQMLRLETRFDQAANEYVLVIGWDDRPEETERFRDLEPFRARVIELEGQLKAENWHQRGAPTIIPDGWRGP